MVEKISFEEFQKLEEQAEGKPVKPEAEMRAEIAKADYTLERKEEQRQAEFAIRGTVLDLQILFTDIGDIEYMLPTIDDPVFKAQMKTDLEDMKMAEKKYIEQLEKLRAAKKFLDSEDEARRLTFKTLKS